MKGEYGLLKRTFIGLFRSHEATGDKATDRNLRTRYYKRSRDKIWDEVVGLIKKKPGYKVLHEVKSVGEIVIEKRTSLGRRQDVTLTLFSINPITTAIDIYSASRGSMGDLGSNYRTILDLYSMIDRQFKDIKMD